MNLLRKLLNRLRAMLPKLRIVWDYSEVDAILRDRDWQMAGPVQRMLGPLLGEGVIMATGSAHTALRRQLGPMPHPDLSDDRGGDWLPLDQDWFKGAQWKLVDPAPADPFAEPPPNNSRDGDLP